MSSISFYNKQWNLYQTEKNGDILLQMYIFQKPKQDQGGCWFFSLLLITHQPTNGKENQRNTEKTRWEQDEMQMKSSWKTTEKQIKSKGTTKHIAKHASVKCTSFNVLPSNKQTELTRILPSSNKRWIMQES